ncbi:hydroxypyruvate isomerase family protein [uncultured Fibrella sp.]|uniref:hydroxypyruvate isomerase family protein n=1 Tax=uncultured Fibrella sp. TaxID=1284596 RepID=UPI0035CB3C93
MTHRRDFIKSALGATGVAFAGTSVAHATIASSSEVAGSGLAGKNKFKLDYAPHIGMFQNSAGKDPIDQLKFMADQGFTAIEDNGMMGREPALQEKMGAEMARLGLKMGVYVFETGNNWKVSFTTGKKEFVDNFMDTAQKAIETSKRCGGKLATVVPGYFERNLPMGIQTGHVIDVLRRGADVLAKNDIVMVLEPLSDNPDLFMRTSDQTYALCRAVNSPSCKILFDIYHMQRNEGHIIPHIDWAWDEIGYFQIGDNPGRKEPTTGEINYKNIFKHIYDKAKASNRSFIFGMEHGNSLPGREGEMALIKAYVESDSFAS